jgi:hypothetical protein
MRTWIRLCARQRELLAGSSIFFVLTLHFVFFPFFRFVSALLCVGGLVFLLDIFFGSDGVEWQRYTMLLAESTMGGKTSAFGLALDKLRRKFFVLYIIIAM